VAAGAVVVVAVVVSVVEEEVVVSSSMGVGGEASGADIKCRWVVCVVVGGVL
jgi:hypothetical protein